MRKQVKILITIISFVLILGTMLVGVYAAVQQNSGFSAKISFEATNVTCQMIGRVYGTNETSNLNMPLKTFAANDETVTQAWEIAGTKNTGGSLIPKPTDYTITFGIAIRNIATAGGTSFWIFPTQKATELTNISIKYKQYTISSVTTNLTAAMVDAYHSSGNATEKTIDVSGDDMPYNTNSSDSFGLRVTDSDTSNALQPNQVFYFEIQYRVIDKYVSVAATDISFGLFMTSETQVVIDNTEDV